MNSLQEFALRAGSVPEPPAAPNVMDYEEKREEWRKIALLKQSILEQLQGGNEPESILYAAIYALSIATRDPDFLENSGYYLNGDKEELNFFPDPEELKARREERRRKYYGKRLHLAQKQLKELDTDREALTKELEVIKGQLQLDNRQKFLDKIHEGKE